jgi:hypothetical protein
MATTPASTPPRYSKALTSDQVENSERELFELLQKALAPSFVLVRRIGSGGMGIVFLARDPALKRLVAVKVMAPDRALDAEARARFQREAESVAKISHPNVVAIYSVGELTNGVPYLVMQYVEGRSMADRLIEEGPLDVNEAKAIIGQVAAALGAAHAKGVVHRDIKAANILWDDAAGRALVSDFGIAALLERDSAEGNPMELTQTGAVVGTPKYMSPEQLLAERVSEKTDVYSLGLLGYELLAREGPFLQASSPNQMIVAHLRDAPRPLSSLRSDVDPAFEALIGSCLEKDPHSRPAAEDVARRLHHSASVVLEWPPPGLEDLHGAAEAPLRKFVRGAFAVAVPLTYIAAMPAASGLRLGYPAIIFAPLVAAMGGIGVVSAMGEGYRLFRIAVRAARAGYGWGIIAEVLVDRARDAGALIAGEREYAALTAAQRSAIRRWRVLGAAFDAAAGLWAIGGFLIGLPIAARVGGGTGLLALWTLGVPLGLLIAGREMRRREHLLVNPIRAKLRTHRSPIDRLSHLAETWRDAFDRVIAGVGRGQGTVGRIARRAAVVGAAAVIGASGLIGAAGLLAVSVGNEASQSFARPMSSSIREKQASIERLRALRPAIDPSITPTDAGYALQSITNAGKEVKDRNQNPTRFPIASLDLPAKDPFKNKFSGGNAIRRARAGFTREERAFLEQVAALPGHDQLSLISRARLADWYGVALKPPSRDMVAMEVPIPSYSRVKAAAYANVARAALALADGRAGDAERLLREDIGMGFVLTEGPTAIENLIGVVIVGIGRAELVALYEMTGRQAEARLIAKEADPVMDPVLFDGAGARLVPNDRGAYTMSVIRDKTAPHGARVEAAVFRLAYQPCSDLGQVLFGPGPTHEQNLAEARRLLVRTTGEDMLMHLAEHALDTPGQWNRLGVPVSGGYGALIQFARVVDGLTGSKRMQSCMMLQPF